MKVATSRQYSFIFGVLWLSLSLSKVQAIVESTKQGLLVTPETGLTIELEPLAGDSFFTYLKFPDSVVEELLATEELKSSIGKLSKSMEVPADNWCPIHQCKEPGTYRDKGAHISLAYSLKFNEDSLGTIICSQGRTTIGERLHKLGAFDPAERVLKASLEGPLLVEAAVVTGPSRLGKNSIAVKVRFLNPQSEEIVDLIRSLSIPSHWKNSHGSVQEFHLTLGIIPFSCLKKEKLMREHNLKLKAPVDDNNLISLTPPWACGEQLEQAMNRNTALEDGHKDRIPFEEATTLAKIYSELNELWENEWQKFISFYDPRPEFREDESQVVEGLGKSDQEKLLLEPRLKGSQSLFDLQDWHEINETGFVTTPSVRGERQGKPANLFIWWSSFKALQRLAKK